MSNKDYNFLDTQNEYKQRYRSRLVAVSREDEDKKQTLEEKIKAREEQERYIAEARDRLITNSDRVAVNLLGRKYYIVSRKGISNSMLKEIAQFADDMLQSTSKKNYGIPDNKVAILTVLDMAEKYITLKNKYNNVLVDYLYYKQREEDHLSINPVQDTPMQKLVDVKGKKIDEKD